MSALDKAQRAHDNKTPEQAPDDFTDTPAGQSWLLEAAEDLLGNIAVRVNGSVTVQPCDPELIQKIAERFRTGVELDEEGHFELLLIEICRRGAAYPGNRELLDHLEHFTGTPTGYPTMVHQLAAEVLAPWGNTHQQWLLEQDEAEPPETDWEPL